MRNVRISSVFMCLTFGAALLALCAPCSRAQEKKAAGCQVTITAPIEGERVGPNGTARGTAALPSQAHFWILAHVKDFNGWWPQGGGPVNIKEGRWSVLVTYGRPPDVGRQFEVAAAVVSEQTDSELRRWVVEAPDKDYPPTDFPNTVESCVPVRVTVERTK